MARLTRKNIKVFAGNATNNGVFGSLQAENPVTTTNVEQIQSLPAWNVGWDSATMTSEKLPPLEEFQGIQYVTTYQQAYLMQEGMPEWASTVTYYKGSLAKEVTSNGFRIYCSLTDNNENHLLSDTSNWKKIMDSQDLYAFDDSVVHKAGNETITGTKTFSQDINIKNDAPIVYLQDNDVVKGTNPASEQVWAINNVDSVGNDVNHRIGVFSTDLLANGTTFSGIYAFKNEANSNINASIKVYYPISGNPYATAPTPTDTTSTSSTQIATTGWVNSTGNNVVHRTDNEIINGVKRFFGEIFRANQNITKGTAPSSAINTVIIFTDKDGKQLGDVYHRYEVNKNSRTVLQATKANASGDTDTASICINYPASGNPYGEAPASDVNGSILTTVNKSKSPNGYFKLGNGLIVQWGTLSSATTTGTLTFPLEWPSTNYIVVGNTSQNINRGDQVVAEFFTKTTKNCKYNSSYACQWIAVGY